MMTNDYTMLYVEDDLEFAELNIPWFRERGYNVVHARNGAQAISLFRRTAPDFVLLDIVLPDIGGFDVFKRFRQIDNDIPVIFLTSLSDGTNAIKGLEMGAHDYIRKEADLAEIDTRIKVILARVGGHNSIIRLTENSYADSRRMAIVVHGTEYKTCPRTVRLLRLLAQQRNHICQRETLIDKVWGENNVNGDVYLNQAIANLRRTLSADSGIHLTTFRNIGVMLETED